MKLESDTLMADLFSTPVCLTGIGAITPFASGWQEVFRVASASGVTFAPWGTDLDPPHASARLGLVKDYPKARYCSERQLRLMDRAMALSVVASGMAFEDAHISDDDRIGSGERIGTITASMRGEWATRYRFAMPMLGNDVGVTNPAHFSMVAPSAVCGQIALSFGLRGWSTALSSGEISGMHALARGASLVAAGRAPIVVVCVYEVFSKITLHQIKARWRKYGRCNLLQSDLNSDVPVEGACAFILESAESAARRGVDPYALLWAMTHGYLHDDRPDSYRAVVSRHLGKAPETGAACDFVMSGLGGANGTSSWDELGVVTSLLEQYPQASELRTRPLFGDGAAQSVMFQVASAAQMLKNQRVEPAFMLDARNGITSGERPRAAIATQLTDRGAYGLISIGRA